MTLRLIHSSGALGLAVPSDSVEAVLKRLGLYRLRADVQFSAADAARACAVRGKGAMQALEDADLLPGANCGALACRDGAAAVRLTDDTVEIYVLDGAVAHRGLDNIPALDAESWRAARIRAGQVTIDASNSESFTPHMLSLDRAGAVSFEKGCYTGQEIVARTEHRGRVKRRLAGFDIPGATPQTGDKFSLDDRDVGEVVNAAGEVCLAVVATEHLNAELLLGRFTARRFDLPFAAD